MGPCFGNEGYFDLKLSNAFDGNYYVGVGNRTGFTFPSKYNRAFTPESKFKISELEILKVNFES